MKNIIIEIGKNFLCIFFVFPIKNNRIFLVLIVEDNIRVIQNTYQIGLNKIIKMNLK